MSTNSGGWWLIASIPIKPNTLPWLKKFKKFDLFKADFVRTCLNRLQMANNQQMIDLDDREKNLKFAGTLVNPIHVFKTTY